MDYQKALLEAQKILQECQENEVKTNEKIKNKDGNLSCFECEKFIDCEIRNKYVGAVYASMNEGHGGDFDF